MRNIKIYVFRIPAALRGATWRKKLTPDLLGEGMGGQKMPVVLARQALALYYLIFCEHLWTPHRGWEHHAENMQSLPESITGKECRVICSTEQHVNKYATHMYLHKCRIIGLLQRGEEEECWNLMAYQAFPEGCCLSVCLCWLIENHMWFSDVENEKYLHIKMGKFLV